MFTVHYIPVLGVHVIPCTAFLLNIFSLSVCEPGVGATMRVAAPEYEEGSEEEEPFEREFYDDDDDGDDDERETQAADLCDDYPLPEEEEEEASGEEPCDGAAPPEDDNASDEEPFYSELYVMRKKTVTRSLLFQNYVLR